MKRVCLTHGTYPQGESCPVCQRQRIQTFAEAAFYAWLNVTDRALTDVARELCIDEGWPAPTDFELCEMLEEVQRRIDSPDY